MHAAPTDRPGTLRRLADLCYSHRRLVVLAWVLVLVGVSVASSAAGGHPSDNFTLPSSPSQEAFTLLQRHFPARAGDTVTVVGHDEAGMDDPAVRARFSAVLDALGHQPHVVGVQSPYTGTGRRTISPDGRIAFATLQLDQPGHDVPRSAATAMMDTARRASGQGLEVQLGGTPIESAQRQKPSGEAIGLLAAVVILLLAFGSVLAMGLPLLTAMFGIGVGLGLVGLLSAVADLPTFASTLAAMIGIGVGIDYALFIVTRYRQGLASGLEPRVAVATAVDTSGRAVMFAGLTVIISLLGMFLMGITFVQGLAVGAALAVLTTMVAAVSLLPAVLGFVGHTIDRLKVPGLHRQEASHRHTAWWRWSRVVQRRAWPLAVVGLLVAVILALPTLSMRLGNSDAGNDPASTTTHKAYALLSRGFGPGFNGSFLVVTQLPATGGAAVTARLATVLAADTDVAGVTPARVSPDGTVAVLTVFPRSAPQDAATGSLLHRLRQREIPAAVAGTGAVVRVGGVNAVFDDLSHTLARRLPLFIGAVVGLSFLLLMAVFRSVLVPLKAAVMNLLSIGAAYGVIVAIFQWGWAKQLVGIDRAGPIDAFLPMMLFAILFGLSMDYEVFLLSRVREEWIHTGDNATAVADGLAATARVITAAAAIMVTLFLSFVLGDNRVIKLFGVGLASAIFIDATLIRMVVVPATMELLGDRNWWLPAWLDRVLPHLDVERATTPAPAGGRQPELAGVA